MDVQVIEIPDDPHYERGRPRKRMRRMPPPRPEEVIDVFDSDEEQPPQTQLSSASNSFRMEATQPRTLPSPRPQPLFLPEPEPDVEQLQQQPGPSALPASPRLEQQQSSSRREVLPLRREASVYLPAPADPESVPVPDDESDQFGGYVAQVLEIVPDVDPPYVLELLMQYYPDYRDKVVEPVLHRLFEDPSYPKLEKGKGKRKRDDGDENGEVGSHDGPVGESGKGKGKDIDYTKKDRPKTGGVHYMDLAVEQLSNDFPLIPKNHIRHAFAEENSLFVPTYLRLVEDQKRNPLPYKPITSSRSRKNKGKGVQWIDEELDRERKWLDQKLQREREIRDAEVAEQLRDEERIAAGDGIECGCCFSEYPFDKMVQCPEAHLFCVSCMTTYSETLLGAHDPKIVCMDQSGCKLAFPESELRRFLSPKLIQLYERVKQQKEIESAGLDNLEECPFCDYKVVIENEQEKLFRCENAECGAVSCRSCKKVDHLPKSCKEAEVDKKLDGRHAIEEAMTRALMRNCPKCKKAFIKELGCNKMSCPNCHTLSCYVCRKIITGYDHFDQRRPESRGPPRPGDAGKCLLWDSVEKRHADEVAAAAKRAIEEYKRDHPDIEEKDLQVDLPKAPPAGPSNTNGLPAMPPPLPRGWMHHGIPPLPAHLALHPPHRVQHIGNIDPQAEMNGLIHRALLPPGEVHVHHHHHPQNPVFNLHLNLDRVRALENRLNAPALAPIPLPELPPAQFLPPNLPPAPVNARQLNRRPAIPPAPRKRRR